MDRRCKRVGATEFHAALAARGWWVVAEGGVWRGGGLWLEADTVKFGGGRSRLMG